MDVIGSSVIATTAIATNSIATAIGSDGSATVVTVIVGGTVRKRRENSMKDRCNLIEKDL